MQRHYHVSDTRHGRYVYSDHRIADTIEEAREIAREMAHEGAQAHGDAKIHARDVDESGGLAYTYAGRAVNIIPCTDDDI